ncbi:MAG: RNA methyltransferase [Vicinamibacterales bacterium]
MQHITSRQNAVVKEYREAARGDATSTMLLDGPRLIGEALDAGIRLQHLMVGADVLERPDVARLLQHTEAEHVTIASASSAVMDAVSPVQTTSGMVALASRPPLDVSPYTADDALVAIVCDMQNPGNVGAIIRVAEAAGAHAVVVAGQSADPFGWKALRGSMGSALRLPISIAEDARDAVKDAKAHGASVVATVPRDGVMPDAANFRGRVALLIGGEGLGLTPDTLDHADQRVSIPMQAPVESLNAAVAAAVLL